MRRREFITLLGGAAAAWPLAARAQQTERMPARRRVSMRSQREQMPAICRGFLEQAAANWARSTGRNIAIDYRWAGGR